ncbi:MAG: sulfatase-like hydrolase/transferase [Isosphaeraceae bacterium]|nr:sulfatase-like hydrolase/transferase [Isosphaeraceae bacterium]
MSRLRARLRPLLLFAWAGLFAVLCVIPPESNLQRVRAPRPSPERRGGPNVLIIVADDHAGGTLGIDGDPRQATPMLDALARQGVRFDRAYCNSPLCTPSRQALITGRLPHAVGVTRLSSKLPDDAVTLGDWLTDFGYRTAAYGKMHFNSRSRHGFSERLDTRDWRAWLEAHPPLGGDLRRPWHPFVDPPAVWLNAACRDAGLPEASMESTFYADRAVEFLRRRREDAAPFALVVSFYEPHSPFRFPRGDQGRYRPGQFPVPPLSDSDRREQPEVFRPLLPGDIQGIQAAYYTSLSFLDRQAGRVVAALDELGLGQDTLVVYVGDNGYLLGQHGRFEKHCMYEPAVRVPLLLRWPGRLPADRAVSDMVEMVDVLPTVLDLLNLPLPSDLHGQSLVAVAQGRAGAKGRDVVFSEYLECEEAMVRSERHKLVVGSGLRALKDGCVPRGTPPSAYERLYDLEADPGETTDVADRPELNAVRNELRRRLYERLTSTRLGVEPVPSGLNEAQAIQWCLVPRDER